MEYGEMYFYTSTVRHWIPLLKQFSFEPIVLDSIDYLTKKECIKVYGFVIMPNHMHLILESLRPNGKESPIASLMKYTAHCFEERLRDIDPVFLERFAVDGKSRKYNFWQAHADTFLLLQENTIEQKLEYIHFNPLQEHWNLAQDPVGYLYSSARFYYTGEKNFSFLYDYRDRTMGFE